MHDMGGFLLGANKSDGRVAPRELRVSQGRCRAAWGGSLLLERVHRPGIFFRQAGCAYSLVAAR